MEGKHGTEDSSAAACHRAEDAPAASEEDKSSVNGDTSVLPPSEGAATNIPSQNGSCSNIDVASLVVSDEPPRCVFASQGNLHTFKDVRSHTTRPINMDVASLVVSDEEPPRYAVATQENMHTVKDVPSQTTRTFNMDVASLVVSDEPPHYVVATQDNMHIFKVAHSQTNRSINMDVASLVVSDEEPPRYGVAVQGNLHAFKDVRSQTNIPFNMDVASLVVSDEPPRYVVAAHDHHIEQETHKDGTYSIDPANSGASIVIPVEPNEKDQVSLPLDKGEGVHGETHMKGHKVSNEIMVRNKKPLEQHTPNVKSKRKLTPGTSLVFASEPSHPDTTLIEESTSKNINPPSKASDTRCHEKRKSRDNLLPISGHASVVAGDQESPTNYHRNALPFTSHMEVAAMTNDLVPEHSTDGGLGSGAFAQEGRRPELDAYAHHASLESFESTSRPPILDASIDSAHSIKLEAVIALAVDDAEEAEAKVIPSVNLGCGIVVSKPMFYIASGALCLVLIIASIVFGVVVRERRSQPLTLVVRDANSTQEGPRDSAITKIVKQLSNNATAFATPYTPQSVAMAWLKSDANAHLDLDANRSSIVQRYALGAVLQGIGFRNITEGNWSSAPECSWEPRSIACKEGGFVSGLTFGKYQERSDWEPTIENEIFGGSGSASSNNQQDDGIGVLTGFLVPEIEQLSNLTKLDVSYNQLTGTVPIELGTLKSMQVLALNDNVFDGTIPFSICRLTDLEDFSAASNNFVGPIPGCVRQLQKLKRLYLDGNALTSTIPSSIWDLLMLEHLDLRNNAIVGKIPPPPIPAGRPLLRQLRLDENQLTGKLPSELQRLDRLRSLTLSDNDLTDTDFRLWDDLNNFRELKILHFEKNIFRNELPSTLGDMEHLQELRLSQNEFSGTLPQSMEKLLKLKILFLGDNRFEGSFPLWLTGLSELKYLDLYQNGFEGTLPHQIGDLYKLRFLRLSSNRFSGTIPFRVVSIPTLEVLSIFKNKLSGVIPNSRRATQLRELYLYNNELSGIDTDMWGNFAYLEKVHLSKNVFNGTIPYEELGQLSNLRDFRINDNFLTGPILPSIGDLTSISIFEAKGNRLNGTIPAELGQLSSLKNLLIHENKLTGPIPPGIGDLTSLEIFTAYTNALTGSIPFEMGQRSNILGIYLQGNQLTGPIPVSIGNLTSLQSLSLSNNRLTGTIPSKIGQLSSIREIYLENNQLTGPIPPSVGDLIHLENLSVYNNTLTGEIPSEFGQLSNRIREIRLWGNNLTGPIPRSFGNLTNVQVLNISSNNLTGTIPSVIWRLSSLREMFLHHNKMTGPAVWGGIQGLPEIHLPLLEQLWLFENSFTGPIPTEVGLFTSLKALHVNGNQLTGTVPLEALQDLDNLINLDLFGNNLVGNVSSLCRNDLDMKVDLEEVVCDCCSCC